MDMKRSENIFVSVNLKQNVESAQASVLALYLFVGLLCYFKECAHFCTFAQFVYCAQPTLQRCVKHKQCAIRS